MRSLPGVTSIAVAASIAGCASLLPRSRAENLSAFQSYEAAQARLEAVQPHHTTVSELSALGFDPAGTANVERVPYPQWIGSLMHPGMPLQTVDEGIRECIDAAQACRALIFRYGMLNARREGGFWGDFLNFRRVTRTVGWRFEAVMLVRGDVVLFRSHAGQPHIEQLDVRRNPLGPLQSVGETVPRGAIAQ